MNIQFNPSVSTFNYKNLKSNKTAISFGAIVPYRDIYNSMRIKKENSTLPTEKLTSKQIQSLKAKNELPSVVLKPKNERERIELEEMGISKIQHLVNSCEGDKELLSELFGIKDAQGKTLLFYSDNNDTRTILEACEQYPDLYEEVLFAQDKTGKTALFNAYYTKVDCIAQSLSDTMPERYADFFSHRDTKGRNALYSIKDRAKIDSMFKAINNDKELAHKMITNKDKDGHIFLYSCECDALGRAIRYLKQTPELYIEVMSSKDNKGRTFLHDVSGILIDTVLPENAPALPEDVLFSLDDNGNNILGESPNPSKMIGILNAVKKSNPSRIGEMIANFKPSIFMVDDLTVELADTIKGDREAMSAFFSIEQENGTNLFQNLSVDTQKMLINKKLFEGNEDLLEELIFHPVSPEVEIAKLNCRMLLSFAPYRERFPQIVDRLAITRDSKGNTPLHVADGIEINNILFAFKEEGAVKKMTTARNNDNQTPLHGKSASILSKYWEFMKNDCADEFFAVLNESSEDSDFVDKVLRLLHYTEGTAMILEDRFTKPNHIKSLVRYYATKHPYVDNETSIKLIEYAKANLDKKAYPSDFDIALSYLKSQSQK